ncbi:MAG: hypothetical protein RL564_1623 [Pseudomonadota bacterium]
MSEEKTQIFRGDEPPEMAIADTTAVKRARARKGPSDQRAVHDAEHGETLHREMDDTHDGHVEQRSLHDGDGLADLRQLHGKDVGEGATALHDGDGAAISRHMHDADGNADGQASHRGDGPSDGRHLHDADGLTDARHSHDGDGESDPRHMHDAEGLSDQRSMHDAQGLSDMREMHDQQGLHGRGTIGDVALEGEDAEHDAAADALADQAEAEAEVMSDPDLTFKVEEEATPWALSIHLEERIASLGESTAKVNRQLDRFEESIQRLAKRIAK